MPAYGIADDLIATDVSILLDGAVPAGVLKVPAFLLEPLPKVKAAVNKALKRAARGENLGAVLDEHELVDLAQQPNAVIRLWISRFNPNPNPQAVLVEPSAVHDVFWAGKDLTP